MINVDLSHWLNAEHTAEILAQRDARGAPSPAPADAGKLYRGRGGRFVLIIEPGKEPRGLDPRQDLRCHSPDGFSWGYNGSGPSQLALAMCADALGCDRRAMDIYQHFKRAVIARLQAAEFEISAEEVRQRCAALEDEGLA